MVVFDDYLDAPQLRAFLKSKDPTKGGQADRADDSWDPQMTDCFAKAENVKKSRFQEWLSIKRRKAVIVWFLLSPKDCIISAERLDPKMT